MPVLSFLGSENLRTIAYVDGYNLYYGCLKGTPYKWLDLVHLIETILRIQDPSSELLLVKYFTAPIKARLASQAQLATKAQQDYHRALVACGRLELFEGWYSLERAFATSYQDPPDKQKRVPIWRLEEKESDVALAMHLYRDAVKNACDQVIVVSSDSDFVPAMKMVRIDAPAVRLGIIFPRREAEPSVTRRPANARMSNQAHWTRQEIRTAELAACQLPDRVPTRKRPVERPSYW